MKILSINQNTSFTKANITKQIAQVIRNENGEIVSGYAKYSNGDMLTLRQIGKNTFIEGEFTVSDQPFPVKTYTVVDKPIKKFPLRKTFIKMINSTNKRK